MDLYRGHRRLKFRGTELTLVDEGGSRRRLVRTGRSNSGESVSLKIGTQELGDQPQVVQILIGF